MFVAVPGHHSAHAASWTGCYIGAQLGAARSEATWNYNSLNPFNSTDPAGPLLVAQERFDQIRGVVGGQAGCNYSFAGPWLFGLEAGLVATPMDLTRNNGVVAFTDPGDPTNIFVAKVRTEISTIGSLTARAGLSIAPDWLLYAKGGYAFALIELRGNISPSGLDQFTWSDKRWHHGWTVGGGIEHRLTPNVTIGAEYNYYRFDSGSYFGAMGGLGPANQVRLDADAEVHTVMARMNFHRARSPEEESPPSRLNGTFSSFMNNSVKFASWDGSRGSNVFDPARGHGYQVFSPTLIGLDYYDPATMKVETRFRGGYVYSAQRTRGQEATYRGPVDTQVSINTTLHNFESVRPQFGVTMNLPTGTPYLPLNQRFARMDPDLVEVGSFGAGFNINPTAGFVIGLNENTAMSFSAGYAWNGRFVREAIDLSGGGGFGNGAFDLKRRIDPGDVFTGNVNFTTEIGQLVLLASFAYMSESRVTIDGVPSGRAGDRYTSNVTANYQLDDRRAIAFNASWNFQRKNEIAMGGTLVPEPKNSNSHVLIGSIEPSYLLSERLRVAANYSILWRDENFYDQIENQFIPAKIKHTVGLSANYLVSPTASIELRGSHSWVRQEDSALLPLTVPPPPPLVAPTPPALSYRAWAVSTSANVRF